MTTTRTATPRPEFRRIKAIELTPQSVASDVAITDDELHAAYDEHKSQYVTPGKRSAADPVRPR